MSHVSRYHDIIDRLDGYTVGTVIVEGDSVTLETQSGESIPLDSAKSIEILNGDAYVAVTVEECHARKTSEGWPLFAGFYARVRF